jgi:hypothetical protein
MGWVCECGETLDFDGFHATCAECGKKYVKTDDGVRREDG